MLPRSMYEYEIVKAIEGFALAARLAVEVGFDGVEIPGTNGNLLEQFMTDYTNRRDDAWGGSVERRVRLSMEVASAVRRAIGTHVPLGMRISQAKINDFEHKWAEATLDAGVVFGSLATVGLN